jgi:uncharacterized membrane protein YgcG
VKALVAYPDVLARMAESPQWVADLGEAYQAAYPALAATIQQLRARAESNGNLRSNGEQYVYRQNDAIYVQPVSPAVVYAPYYNPMVVYGTWWWPTYQPVFWRPWVARPVFVTRVIQPVRIVQPVRTYPGYMPHATQIVRQPVGLVRPLSPMPAPRAVSVTPYRAIPESRRAPVVQSAPIVRTAPVQHIAPMRAAPAQHTFNQGQAAHGGGSGWHGGARSGGGSRGGGHRG